MNMMCDSLKNILTEKKNKGETSLYLLLACSNDSTFPARNSEKKNRGSQLETELMYSEYPGSLSKPIILSIICALS